MHIHLLPLFHLPLPPLLHTLVQLQLPPPLYLYLYLPPPLSLYLHLPLPLCLNLLPLSPPPPPTW
jgi:hypothetical protein